MAGTAARTDTGAGTGVCDICFSALRCDVSAFNKDGSKAGYRICNPNIIAVQPETVAADSGGSAEITSCTGKNTMPFVRIGTAFFTVAPTGSQCALPGDSQRAFFGNVNARNPDPPFTVFSPSKIRVTFPWAIPIPGAAFSMVISLRSIIAL